MTMKVFVTTLQTERYFKTPFWAAVLIALCKCASESPEDSAIKRAKQMSVIEGDQNWWKGR